MRFHIGAAGAVLALSAISGVTHSEAISLIIIVGGVMALECVNTAIEFLTDLACKGKRSEYAKAAKDCAAGAVLVFCFAAIGAAIVIFGKRVSEIISVFFEKPLLILAAVIYCAIWFWWVFLCFQNDDKIKRKKV